MKKQFFTLSFDDKEIKVLELQNGKRFCVDFTALEPGIVESGKILKKNDFAETLRKLLKTIKPNKIISKYVVASLPESKVFIKILEIPKIDKEKIDEAIGWQAESLLPVSPDNVYLDWQQIAETPEGKIKILITACPKDVIDSLIESLEDNGFTLIGIKSKSGALAGIFSDIPHKAVLIINIEEDETSLIVCKNSVARVSTSIPSLKDPDLLFDKVSQTIDFYQKRKGEREIKEIILLGDEEPGDLKEKLFAQTKIVTKHGHFPSKIKKLSKNDEKKYLVNLALYFNPLAGINLLPEEKIKELTIKENYEKLKYIRTLIIVTILLMIASLLTAWWLLIFERNKTQNVLSSVQLVNISPKAQEIETKIIDLNSKLTRIQSLSNARSNYAQVLSLVKSVPQDGIEILSFILENQDGKFKISGNADSRDQLLSFKENLQNNGSFINITIPLKSLEKPNNISFDISFNYKR